MPARLGGEREKSIAKRVSWPALSVAPSPEPAGPPTQEARKALADALAEADRFRKQIEEMEKALQSKEELGYERGLAEGRAQSFQEAAGLQRPVLDRMAHAIADLAMLRPQLRMQSEAGLIRLCVAIAHRILKREVHMDPLALEGIVEAALSKVASEEVFRIRVHPNQAETVRALLSRLGVPESVRVEPAASLDEGDVMVETASGSLDASVNTQIAEVERGITARLTI
jgi:flagellar assembly protein FliH